MSMNPQKIREKQTELVNRRTNDHGIDSKVFSSTT